MHSIVFHVLLVIFIATLIRSAVGFGEALLAVPLLAFRIPVDVAAPLAVLVSITVAGVIIAQDWRKIHFYSAGHLVIATLFGIPLGLLFLKICGDTVARIALGSIIIAFSVYALIWRNKLHLNHDSQPLLYLFGFIAGILGGAYGMNGPPLAVYGAMRRWSPQHFRATLQGYFLPASAVGMVGYWFTGLWTRSVTRYYLMSLPVALVAILLGRAINHRLSTEGLIQYIYIALIGIGTLLLVQALHV